MDSNVFNNVLPLKGCEKLYLNSRTSDVNFIFRSEKVEIVPAHKNILSIISPIFDAMFYGPNKRDGDIDILGSSPEAFKEFLQFFYCNQVKLSVKNVAEVLNLGRQYLLSDWKEVANACTDLYTSSLTLDNMCMGYELSVLYELSELLKFCETKIGENAAAVFRSSSFLGCSSYLLRYILQLDTFQCDESTVFDGCMVWARAECVRKQWDENNVQNLRAQLGELIYEIRFGDMSLVDFEQRYRLYDGLFSLEEFRDITMMIARKDYQPEKFNRSSRTQTQIKTETPVTSENVIVCERKRSDLYTNSKLSSTTILVSASKLSLKKICCYLSDKSGEIQAKIKIYNCSKNSSGNLVLCVKPSLKSNRYIDVELPAPLIVQPGITYKIDVELNSKCTPVVYEKSTRINGDTKFEISDRDDYSFISGFGFVECKNRKRRSHNNK